MLDIKSICYYLLLPTLWLFIKYTEHGNLCLHVVIKTNLVKGMT